jgi:hypothetical protein
MSSCDVYLNAVSGVGDAIAFQPIWRGCQPLPLLDVHVILDGHDTLDIAGNQDRLVDVIL